MADHPNAELFRRGYGAFQSGDLETVRTLFADDIVWHIGGRNHFSRDYVGADGSPGYFRQRLFVYERRGKPCRVCRTPIRAHTQGQRSTYYCPHCQS